MNRPFSPDDRIDALRLDSPGWLFFVKASFASAMLGMLAGIYLMPVDLWIRGYLMMGTLFTIGSSFTLAKTMRDQFESAKLINRLSQAKAEKLLEEYDAS